MKMQIIKLCECNGQKEMEDGKKNSLFFFCDADASCTLTRRCAFWPKGAHARVRLGAGHNISSGLAQLSGKCTRRAGSVIDAHVHSVRKRALRN